MRDWLKEKRVEKGMTMAQISEKLEISEPYYCLIEAGERQKKMDIVLVGKLSVIFDIPVTEIINLEAM